MLTTEILLFPPLSHFIRWKQAGHWQLQGAENYQKGSFRNKYAIMMSNGLHQLSVPLTQGKNQSTPIQLVEINYSENWQKNHLETLKTAYGKTPFFEDYFPEIEALIRKKHRFLWDKNIDILNFLILILDWQLPYSIAQEFLPYSTEFEQVDSQNYYNIFNKNICNYKNISILDILFNLGSETIFYFDKINYSSSTPI